MRESNKNNNSLDVNEWVELKTKYAINNINKEYFPIDKSISILKDFYKIMYSFNFPYSNFEELNNEFKNCNLHSIKNLYGGSGLSFQLDKPKSMIVLAEALK